MKFPTIQELYSVFKKSFVVTTDSRNTPPGSIFFSLSGENFDGNDFAASSLAQGCDFAVIDKVDFYKGEKYILVKECLKTLQELAVYHRKQLTIPVIAITGSNGKTTTKELLKCVLEKKFSVLATKGNLNNHIGVPLTILSITPAIELAIIEMGANHIGEIGMLCEIAQPDLGLITNIGKAHLGEFGSFEKIVMTKTEMYKYIKAKKGKIFINADNHLLLSNALEIDKITYGTSAENFCPCQFVDANPCLKVKFENETVASHLVGKYNFENVAAAICIGKYFGVETGQIKAAIEGYVPSNNRSQSIQTKLHTLVLDAYNANPSSMKAAIENFSDMKNNSKWLILGDMLELGNYEIEEHKSILNLINEKKFQNVILVGDKFRKAALGMKLNIANLILFDKSDELAKELQLKSPIDAPSLILIKGSRGIKLEKAVEFL